MFGAYETGPCDKSSVQSSIKEKKPSLLKQ